MFFISNNKSFIDFKTKVFYSVFLKLKFYMTMKKEALQKAVKTIGSQTALAKALNVTQAHVWNWLNRDTQVTAEYVLPIEKLTGVPRHELRPDIYPPEEYKKAS